MDTKSLHASIAQFVHSVAAEFDSAEVVAVSAMAGSANRLWHFTTAAGIFVVKELPYNDGEDRDSLRQAADFV